MFDVCHAGLHRLVGAFAVYKSIVEYAIYFVFCVTGLNFPMIPTLLNIS
jgi:hypothetical protein